MDHDGHGDMKMAPSGIALAEGGENRDGLEMNVLHLRLGPVLPHWPPGLTMRCALQGDVVSGAQAELVDAEVQQRDADSGTEPPESSTTSCRFWRWPAGTTQPPRHDASATRWLENRDRAATAVRLHRLRRKVKHSLPLRWSLRGIRPLRHDDLERDDLPIHLGGDTYARLLGMFDRACDHNGQVVAVLRVDILPHLVTGLDLAAARLVVVSLDIHKLQSGHLHDELTRA